MIYCVVLALTSIALVMSAAAQPPNTKGTVLYARTNIYSGRVIEPDAVGETQIEKDAIPNGAVRAQKDAVSGESLGIYCGQILVYKRVPSGPNKGVLDAGGYQPIKEIDRTAAPVSGKTGVIDLTGAWIIQPNYCEVHYTPASKYFWVTKLQHNLPKAERDALQARLGRYVISDIWQALDSNGKPVDVHLPLSGEGFEWPSRGHEFPDKVLRELLIFRTTSGIGVCDDHGRIIISPQFESIHKLTSGRFLCLRLAPNGSPPSSKKVTPEGLGDASWEIRSSMDKLLTKLPTSVWDAYDGSQNFLLCRLPNEWGVINQSGKTLVPPLYSGLHPFSEGLAAVVSKTNKAGYINSAGKVAIPLRYSEVGDFKDGLAMTTSEKKPAKRDKHGNLEFSEAKSGVIDQTGKVLLPFEYDYLRWLPNNTITAAKGNSSMVLDRKFKTLLKFDRNTFIYDWSEDRYLASVNEQQTKKQFLDQEGNRIGPEFEDITCFRGGHAVVALKKGHYGVIDKQGQWVIPPEYARLEFCGDNRLIAETLTN